ncbi:MAG: CPXCG motif-containing cysteine-rich protein [Pseudomonadota bacterium]
MLVPIDCPYCGQCYTAVVETLDGCQDYIEDCPVCCRPIELHVETGDNGELLALHARRDDD